ncbi:T9SS type A sorting domain-containing protein [Flavobacterium sp.]|uniref:T9SS type A sorting domain-containing protein n=1 Tax=Flavobacterium sp. TaxID=239 RepID=UPI003D115323
MKKIITLIALVFATVFAQAQVTDGQYGLSISAATATSNTIDVTLSITVLGPSSGMRLFGFQTSINFNSAIINGGTITASYVSGTRSPELSAMTFGTLNSATVGTIRIPLSAFSSGATSVDMPVGTTYTLGTYRISNTVNWADGNANLWLQDVSQSGRTRSAVNGYPYGSSTSQYAYSTTTPASPPGLVLSHLEASPYSLSLGTLSAGNFIQDGDFTLYPNPTSDIVKVECSKQVEKVIVYNLLGQEILTQKGNEKEVTLDVRNIPSGNYILNVYVRGGGFKSSQLVKK